MSGPRAKGLDALARLKPWLTVQEAAKYLSLMLDSDVAESDVLRLALDGPLRLSVRFVNGAYGRRVRTDEEAAAALERFEARVAAVARANAAGEEPPGADDQSDSDRPLVFLGDAVCDLPLTGGERLDVEQRYQELTGGPSVDLVSFEGACVDTPDGVRLQILQPVDVAHRVPNTRSLDPRNLRQADTLPAGAAFVVRTAELHRFEAALAGVASGDNDPDTRPLETRERSSLLTIIAALAHAAGHDLAKTSKSADAIAAMTDAIGCGLSVGAIAGHLKRIPGALERTRKR